MRKFNMKNVPFKKTFFLVKPMRKKKIHMKERFIMENPTKKKNLVKLNHIKWRCNPIHIPLEDHDLHSLNYMHMGASKTWYVVPIDAATTFEEGVRHDGYGV